ncbi:hypothetical protein AAW51_2128 [Caldimonas brevitalea]|uniref:Uncharacterized protein n=1 Tax=Caldimonas brevitalea TaxID=413882 RepID=A0A0G3BHC6_9BURK|nr:hypothetical protein AAW51_2128 [Caldimonas brevitalea]
MKTVRDRAALLVAGVIAAAFAWGSLALLTRWLGSGGASMALLLLLVVALAADNRSLRKQLREHGVEPRWGKHR